VPENERRFISPERHLAEADDLGGFIPGKVMKFQATVINS
jgi:hypothetical protein